MAARYAVAAGAWSVVGEVDGERPGSVLDLVGVRAVCTHGFALLLRAQEELVVMQSC